MFFDAKGIGLTLAAIGAVVALCALDLCCSSGRRDSAQLGAIDRVKGEISAGRDEMALRRRDQLNAQIRDMRVLTRRLLKEGRKAEARRTMAAAQELERQVEKIECKR